MKVAIFLVGFVALLAFAHMSLEESVDSMEEVFHQQHHQPQIRSRRFLETVKRKRCGRQISVAVTRVCDGSCTPGSKTDLSHLCCSKQCNYADLRVVCCPEKMTARTTTTTTTSTTTPEPDYSGDYDFSVDSSEI